MCNRFPQCSPRMACAYVCYQVAITMASASLYEGDAFDAIVTYNTSIRGTFLHVKVQSCGVRGNAVVAYESVRFLLFDQPGDLF